MNKFKIEKIANMIMISDAIGTVYDSWGETNFTERKLNNAIKKIEKYFQGNCEFIRFF